jgi:Ca2+-binding RTX toxin-like protein
MALFSSTSGNDTLTGGTEDDAVFGLGGADNLTGGNGNDGIAGRGNDTVFGGAGDDFTAAGQIRVIQNPTNLNQRIIELNTDVSIDVDAQILVRSGGNNLDEFDFVL